MGEAGVTESVRGDTLMTTKVSDREIRAIAKLELPLPESAKRAGMSRTNFRNRAQKLGFDVKLGASGRPRLFQKCGIGGCTAPYHSNGRCLRHFNESYYQQNSGKAKDRARKQREASRSYASPEELERLRSPENRGESLSFGPYKKIVHLACGWIGDDLTHHIRHCPVKPESWKTYSKYWGLNPSVPPVSPKQREAYSQRQQGIWTSERRSNMARNRRGKGTGPRLQMRKISNSKLLEIVASNPGLSLAEGAKLSGLSRIGFYKRVRKFGDVGALRRLQLEFVRLASNSQLRRRIASQPQDYPSEPFKEFCIDNLQKRSLSQSEFALFILQLDAELRERPAWISEIAAEIERHNPAKSAFRLGTRIFERVCAELKNGNRSTGLAKCQPEPAKTEPEKTVWFELGRKIDQLVSKGVDVTEARRQVKGRYDFDTVVRYHMKYRRHLRSLAPQLPMTK
jgi:hypothetical protein